MRNFHEWTVSDIVQQLSTMGLDQYQDNFEQNDISGEVLPYLTEAHLKELGMRKIGHRLKFLKFIRTVQANPLPDVPVTSTRSAANSNYENSRPKPQSTSTVKQAQFKAPPMDQDDDDDPYFTEQPKSVPPPSSQKSSQWEQKLRQMKMRKMAAGQGQAFEQNPPSLSAK